MQILMKRQMALALREGCSYARITEPTHDAAWLNRLTIALKLGDVSGFMNRLLSSSFLGIPLEDSEIRVRLAQQGEPDQRGGRPEELAVD